MLSMSNVSVEMAGSYFEKDDYYSSENGPAKPEFFGEGAKDLGMGAKFDHEIFENLLQGLSPDGSLPLIQVKPKPLSEQELERVCRNFNRRVGKLGVELDKTKYIQDQIIENAKENGRHFSRDEARLLAAESGKFISLLSLDSQTKNGLKKTTEGLIKSLSKSGHRAALDCTFSAPKSVSLACHVGGRSDLLEAHKIAVDEAMRFIEDRLSGTRIGGKATRRFARTGNIIGAKFHHGTSREGDPQLHTHCVIMNMTKRDKNTWRAMHTDPIYQHSKLAGLLYQNKLAELVQKQGYEIEVHSRGTFELRGYSEKQLEGFSKRRRQVLEASAKLRFDEMKRNQLVRPDAKFEDMKPDLLQQVTQKMNRSGVLAGRQVKAEIKSDGLQSKWQSEAKTYGISHSEMKAGRTLFGTKLDQLFAKDHLTERKSVIKKLDLLVQNLSRNLGRATSRDIAKAGLSDLDLATSYREPSSMASLPHATKEVEISKIAATGKAMFEPLIPGELRSKKLESGFTSDQKKALDVTVASKDQVLIWNGVAGSGKTWALKAVKENALKAGYKVVALPPDASSASVLGRELGTASSLPYALMYKYPCIFSALHDIL